MFGSILVINYFANYKLDYIFNGFYATRKIRLQDRGAHQEQCMTGRRKLAARSVFDLWKACSCSIIFLRFLAGCSVL